MPIYEDLPTVVVPAIVDTVTPEPIDEEGLEELPIPTVHEVVAEVEAEVEEQAAPPEPVVEAAPAPLEPAPRAACSCPCG